MQNKIIGIFSDRMEFGPRALGHRSVLQSNSAEIHDELNRRMNRSEFMPFAPITVDIYADQNFHDYDKTDQCIKL